MVASKSLEALGSIIEIKLPDKFSFLFDYCSRELSRIEEKYSRFKETSQLSKLNNSLNTWVELDEEFIHLIKKSLRYRKDTDGYFDITVKSTLDNLGYDKDYSFEKKTHKRNIIHKIKDKLLKPIKIRGNEVLLRRQIDFGGIGKGYALDMLAKILEENDCDKYYINGGGDIRVKGDWIITLEDPRDVSKTIGKLILKDRAIAASAPNRRKWKDGHHLINPKTNGPANDMQGVFVIADSGMDADVYATSMFVAGFLNAIKLSKKLPVEVLFISADNQYYASSGFDAELYGSDKPNQ